MADVEGTDGSTFSIPDFAMEDTQAKILAALKKQYKLSDKEIQSAKNALGNDNKNSKAQIDALSKMGDDIADAVNKGKGTFFGGLKDTTLGAVSVLSTLTKGVGSAVGIMGTLGMAATAAAVNLTKGFGDEVAGLAASGAAFGELGESLNTTIPQLRTMGLTMGEAVNAVENFRVSMTVLGAKGTTDVIKSFQEITNMGSDYGRTISENIDFLADEIQTRQMLGFFQRRSAEAEAASAKELMDNQLAASKLLGKSVDDIAQSVKQLFGRDDFKASFARMGEDAAETLRKTFATFEGAELGDGMMEGLAKAFTDPIMLQSEEARKSINALRLIDPSAADEIQRNIEGFRQATAVGDTDAAEKFAREAERLTLQTTASIADMGQQDKRRLELQGQYNDALAGTLANQNASKEAFKNYGKEQDITLNKAARTSTMFNNIITLLSNSFGTLYTRIQAGIAPALKTFTDAFGEATDSDSNIAKFQARMGVISDKISAAFNRIFSDSADLGGEGGAIGLVSGLLETLANVIDSTSTNIIDFVDSLTSQEGGTFMEKLSTFVGDMIGDLLAIIGEQIKKIDFMELLFGDSRDEVIENTSQKVDKSRQFIENTTYDQATKDTMLAEYLDNTVADIQDFASDKEFDPTQTLEMIKEAGIKVSELSGEKLFEIFPDPNELKDAIASVYGKDIESAQSAWKDASKKIADHTQDVTDSTFTGFTKAVGEAIVYGGAIGENSATTTRLNEEATAKMAWESASKTEIIPPQTPPETETTNAEKSADAQQALDADKKARIIKAESDKLEKLADKNSNITASESAQPDQPTPNNIMVDPESAEPIATGPSSQDGTKTQEVKPAITTEDNQENANKSLEDLLFTQINILNQIKTNTGRTVAGVRTVAGNTQ